MVAMELRITSNFQAVLGIAVPPRLAWSLESSLVGNPSFRLF
jgi:hypothetical protein